jgi:hypothetical protein
MFSKLYLQTKVGWFALYALFSVLVIAWDLSWGGPPKRDTLKVDVGVLEAVGVPSVPPFKDGNTAYTLRLRRADLTDDRFELYAQSGRQYERALLQFVGKRVEVRSELHQVWELTSGDTKIVDYDARARKAIGNPTLKLGYGILCLVAFAAITATRYRTIRAARALDPTAEEPGSA